MGNSNGAIKNEELCTYPRYANMDDGKYMYYGVFKDGVFEGMKIKKNKKKFSCLSLLSFTITVMCYCVLIFFLFVFYINKQI